MMLDETKILIKDSCILFDLLDLNLVNEFFTLDYEIYTTPQVISEITNEAQLEIINGFVLNRKLKIDKEGSFESIQDLSENYPGLSFTDCSVLELAIRLDGVILSADRTLRNTAIRNSLKVKGMLWIINLLIETGVISDETALEKIKLYPLVNKRAPLKELNEFCITLASRCSS